MEIFNLTSCEKDASFYDAKWTNIDRPLFIVSQVDLPFERGDRTWEWTLAAPALWPKIVTDLESPPKLSMLSLTHSSL